MKDKQKIHFARKKARHVDFSILRLHKVVLCCGVASRCRHWTPLNCTAGWELVEGWGGRKKMRSPSIIFTSVCLGAEFIAVKQEEGGMRRKSGRRRRQGKKVGGACEMAPGCRLECVCVRVLTQSKSICPLWNCGHREGKGVQTQPGHMQAETRARGNC